MSTDATDAGRTRIVTATRDARLHARVLRSTPMRYAAGADGSIDRPPHVRAGSALAWWDHRLAVVQDDVNFIAMVDPADGLADDVMLPAGPGGVRQFDDGRGNKSDKLDVEAVCRMPQPGGAPRIIALGSGSSDKRDTVIVMRAGEDGTPDVSMHELARFYDALRKQRDFAGAELNVEGAVHLARGTPGFRLFNRGNGDAENGDGAAAVNATCDIVQRELEALIDAPQSAPAPQLRDIVQYDLGEIAGCALGFTDATLVFDSEAEDRRVLLYSAAAEESPDATQDGPVVGCAIGVIVEAAGDIGARWAALEDEHGAPVLSKVEGLVLHGQDPHRLYVVVDADDPDVPSELCEVLLEGPWFAETSVTAGG